MYPTPSAIGGALDPYPRANLHLIRILAKEKIPVSEPLEPLTLVRMLAWDTDKDINRDDIRVILRMYNALIE